MKLYSLFPRTVLAVACIFSLAEVSRAAEYFWKAGSGTWDTTSLNWTVGSNPALVAWTTNNNATLSSSSTATSTITLATDPAVPVMNVTSGSWVVVGGGHGFSHLTSPARIFNITGAGTIFSLGGTGSGNGMIGGIVTVGPGATLITTSNNVFGYGDGTRVTSLTVDGGTFRNTTGDSGWGISHIWKNGAVIDLAGGNLPLGNTSTVTVSGNTTVKVTGTGNIFLREGGTGLSPFDVANGASAIDLQVDAKLAFYEGALDKGIDKKGAGTMLITNKTNDYQGVTQISAGALDISGTGVIYSTSGSVTANSKIVVNSGGILVADRWGVGAEESLGLLGAGAAVFSVDGGVLRNVSALDSTFKRGVSVGVGGMTLDSATAGKTWTWDPVETTVFAANAKLTLAGVGNGNYGRVLAGAVLVEKTGTGIWSLSGANSYTGGTTITAGTLVAQTGTSLGDSSGVVNFNGGILRLEPNVTILNPATMSVSSKIEVLGGLSTYAGTISGSAGLGKLGLGNLVLSNPGNSYSGTTQITEGTLTAAANNALGSGVIEFGPTGVLAINDAVVLGNSVSTTPAAATILVASGTGTINGTISGANGLNKTGAGILQLGAAGTYTGPTSIQGGTLKTIGDNALASSSSIDLSPGTTLDMDGTSQILNNLNGASGSTLNFGTGNPTFNNTSDTAVESALIGTGNITKTGPKNLTITSTNTSTTAASVSVLEGGLLVGGESSSSAVLQANSFTVASGAMLGGFGTVTGNVANDGTIAPGGAAANAISTGNFTIIGDLTNSASSIVMLAGKTPGNTLTVKGNYVSAPTTVLNINLGNDKSLSDKIVIDGGTFSGTSVLSITTSGTGDFTQKGIPVVLLTNGAQKAPGASVTMSRSPLIAGLFSYFLFEDIDGWFLRATLDASLAYRPETAAYFGNESVAAQSMVMTMRDRMGNSQSTQRSEDSGFTAWVRTSVINTSRDSDNGLMSYDNTGVLFQFGADILGHSISSGDDMMHFGIMAGYLNASTTGKAGRFAENTSGDVTGMTFGPYVSWFQNQAENKGLYIDAWLLYGSFDNSLSGNFLGEENYSSTGLSASIEAGYRYQFSNRTFVEPQGQIIFQQMGAGDLSQLSQTSLQVEDTSGTLVRLGCRAGIQRQASKSVMLQPYAEGNVWFGGMDQAMKFERVPVTMDAPGTTFDGRLGLQAYWGKSNLWTAWLEGGFLTANDYSSSMISAGLRFNW